MSGFNQESNQVTESNVISVSTENISGPFPLATVENQTLENPTLESKSKAAVITASVIVSCFLVTVLIYGILIRPYLKRKAKKYPESPVDTSRAPMDLTFRQPAKKNCFKRWLC